MIIYVVGGGQQREESTARGPGSQEKCVCI